MPTLNRYKSEREREREREYQIVKYHHQPNNIPALLKSNEYARCGFNYEPQTQQQNWIIL